MRRLAGSLSKQVSMKRSTIILLFICISVFVLAACSHKAGDGKDEAAPPISHFEPLTEIKEGRKNLYVILKVMDSNYWQVIKKGAKAAGDDCDCNVYCGGTGIETDWQGQHVLIEEAVSQKADAVILAPNDSIELTPDLDRLRDLGIPVALIDTAANTDSFDICYMTDNLLAGQNAAEEMIAQLHEAGYLDYNDVAVGIMVGTAKSQTINERLAGFYQYWSNNAPGKWRIVSDIMNCNGNIDQGGQLLNAFLSENPDVCGLFGTNNGPTRVLCQAVREKEMKNVVVVGFDFSDEMKELIEAPDYRASTMLQRQYDMGYKGVESMCQRLAGTEPSVKFVDTGVVTVNKETIGTEDAAEVLKFN